MRGFLIMFLRGVLVLALAFVPVANAMNMAAPVADHQDVPPCHASADQQPSGDKCCQSAVKCHCAMTSCLPAADVDQAASHSLSEHPQTAPRLLLGLSSLPEIPPPKRPV